MRSKIETATTLIALSALVLVCAAWSSAGTDFTTSTTAQLHEAGKHLRVILLDDGETVHNAFFDRSFREE